MGVSETQNGRVVAGRPQRGCQGEETRMNQYVSWWGCTYMVHLGRVFGNAGQSQAHCIERSEVGADLKKTRSCSWNATERCYFAVRAGIDDLRWIYLEEERGRVIGWRSSFS